MYLPQTLKLKIASELFGMLSCGIHIFLSFLWIIFLQDNFIFDKGTKKVLTIIESQKSAQHITSGDTAALWPLMHVAEGFFLFLLKKNL